MTVCGNGKNGVVEIYLFLFTEKAFIFSRNQSLSVWGTYFWNTARYFLVTTKTYRKCVFSPPKFAQIIPCRFWKNKSGGFPEPKWAGNWDLGVSTISDSQKSGSFCGLCLGGTETECLGKSEFSGGGIYDLCECFEDYEGGQRGPFLLCFFYFFVSGSYGTYGILLGVPGFWKMLGFGGANFGAIWSGAVTKDPWSYPQLGTSAQMVECLMRENPIVSESKKAVKSGNFGSQVKFRSPSPFRSDFFGRTNNCRNHFR